MRKLRVLLLADDKPGHYHLAEGVIAALARRGGVEVTRIEVRRHRVFPNRMLAEALSSGVMTPAAVLRLAYGIRSDSLGAADLIVSAGGDTIVPNAALARALGATNIFCGSLRRLSAEHFSLIVSSYESHRAMPRHLVTLKPNAIDPDAPERQREQPARLANGYPRARRSPRGWRFRSVQVPRRGVGAAAHVYRDRASGRWDSLDRLDLAPDRRAGRRRVRGAGAIEPVDRRADRLSHRRTGFPRPRVPARGCDPGHRGIHRR